MCGSRINQIFVVVFIAVSFFNIYAVNNLKFEINDPQLILINTYFIFATCVLFTWNFVWYIVYCCTKRKSKTDFDAATLAQLLAAKTPQKDLSGCSLAEWTIEFEKLAKNLPQKDINKGFHVVGCHCAQKCVHLVTPCRIVMQVKTANDSESVSNRNLTYKNMALIRHGNECNCKCFEDG